jgi:beta-lactamase superfamily II metal-dependent hydrolase
LQDRVDNKKLLEVYFVDIGQGDGCMIITPDDKFILIDAGEQDNMHRFLKWKFNTKNPKLPPLKIQHTIISHSDSDHYQGFAPLFKDARFEFENVFHNGLIERVGDDLLGEIKDGYQQEVITNDAELAAIINNPAKVGRKQYPNLLKTVSNRGAKIRNLSQETGFLPEYEADKTLNIKVLGPLVETDANGKRRMKRFENDGKTKNGHSVVLKLEYKKVKILLGGDLNIPAENNLLEHYTGKNPTKLKENEVEEFLKKARETFQVDIAKSCHHGSADFTNLFMQSVNPAATVVSSGDDEPHAHPRPETLGAIGKFSRGERPLIFSTELARSAKEAIKHPSELHKEIDKLVAIKNEASNPDVIAKITKMQADLKMKIQRTVTVYGMINLRTDGEKVVLAQRLEAKAARGDWDFVALTQNADGELEYVSKHEE